MSGKNYMIYGLEWIEYPRQVAFLYRSYLGDGREAREFAKDFLERRSRWRNANKGGFEDNLCRPASAINPTNSDFQEVKVRNLNSYFHLFA